MEPVEKCECPVCEEREREHQESEELGFAVLIALMPLMAITLFSNMGLF
jgi:hypothetical protein